MGLVSLLSAHFSFKYLKLLSADPQLAFKTTGNIRSSNENMIIFHIF